MNKVRGDVEAQHTTTFHHTFWALLLPKVLTKLIPDHSLAVQNTFENFEMVPPNVSNPGGLSATL